MIAGTGEDTLIGSSGTTTYDIEQGSGDVTILGSGNSDTLLFGDGISAADLTASSTIIGGQTIVTITNDQGDTITLDGGNLSQINFAEGGCATYSQVSASNGIDNIKVFKSIQANKKHDNARSCIMECILQNARSRRKKSSYLP